MPVSQSCMPRVQKQHASDGNLTLSRNSSSTPLSDVVDDLISPSVVHFSTENASETRNNPQEQPMLILSDGPRSLDLCLYALVGLGLCKTAPWVNKKSLGFTPEWYHEMAPAQIGQSQLIGPNCQCSLSVCCFLQPDDTNKPHFINFQCGAMQPLLRKSLFTPSILASRGPPNMS